MRYWIYCALTFAACTAKPAPVPAPAPAAEAPAASLDNAIPDEPPEPIERADSPPADDEPTAPGVDSADACTRAMTRVAAIAAPAGHQVDIGVEAAACRSEGWPADFLACATTVTDLDGYLDSCFKRLFPPDTRLQVVRSFDVHDDNSAVEPKPGTLDGDFTVYNATDQCGVLTKKRGPGEAAYVLCGTTLMGGPLTTVKEVEAVYEEFSRISREGSNLRLKLMQNWPTFRTVRVYDSTGRDLGTRIE